MLANINNTPHRRDVYKRARKTRIAANNARARKRPHMTASKLSRKQNPSLWVHNSCTENITRTLALSTATPARAGVQRFVALAGFDPSHGKQPNSWRHQESAQKQIEVQSIWHSKMMPKQHTVQRSDSNIAKREEPFRTKRGQTSRRRVTCGFLHIDCFEEVPPPILVDGRYCCQSRRWSGVGHART